MKIGYCIEPKLAKGKSLILESREWPIKEKLIIIIMITVHKNLPKGCVKSNHTKVKWRAGSHCLLCTGDYYFFE